MNFERERKNANIEQRKSGSAEFAGKFFLRIRFKGETTNTLGTVFILLIFRGFFGGKGKQKWIQDLCSTG